MVEIYTRRVDHAIASFHFRDTPGSTASLDWDTLWPIQHRKPYALGLARLEVTLEHQGGHLPGIRTANGQLAIYKIGTSRPVKILQGLSFTP